MFGHREWPVRVMILIIRLLPLLNPVLVKCNATSTFLAVPSANMVGVIFGPGDILHCRIFGGTCPCSI